MKKELKNIYYVYQYIRLDNNTIFYVGKGHGNRYLSMHSRSSHFKNIINKVDCVVEITHENLTEDQALGIECITIHDLVFNEGYGISIKGHSGHKDVYLVNQTWGGDGVSGINPWEHLDEVTKDRLRNIARATHKGRKRSLETRRKISEKLKGENNYFYGLRKFGEEHHNYGKKRTEEEKEKISKGLKGKYSGERSHLFRKAVIREDLHGGNIKRYCGNVELSNDGFNPSSVNSCCRGIQNRVGDFIFYFENDEDRRTFLLEKHTNSLTKEQLEYRDKRIIELKSEIGSKFGSNIEISNLLTIEIGLKIKPKHVDSVWYKYNKRSGE